MTDRCHSCRWWVAKRQEHRQGAAALDLRDPETYEVVAPPFEVRECTHPLVLFYERPAANGVALLDGSEYLALMVTGPQFGCVNHESATLPRSPEGP